MKSARSAAIQAKVQKARPFVNEHAILFVSSVEEWICCEQRLRAAVIVGVDTETRPVFYSGMRNRTSLLQLAVRNTEGSIEILVLDLLALEPAWYDTPLTALFRSEQIIKLGQMLPGDLKELSASYPSTSCFTVANAVVEINDLSNVLAGPHSPLSLQRLAFFYINKKLSKAQQVSNWDNRPLSLSQLLYAASDALVLIEIFDELMAHLAVQSKVSFRIQSVMRTLDVYATPPPTCDVCSGVFESRTKLNMHRAECNKRERRLELCFACDLLLLMDAAALDAHRSTCIPVNVM